MRERRHSQLRQRAAAPAANLRFALLLWLLALLLCALLTTAAFLFLDAPLARCVYGVLPGTKTLSNGFAGFVLLGVEALVVLALVGARIVRGHISPLSETTILASLASICAYAINNSVLKRIFGGTPPLAVVHGAPHAFHLLSGASDCCFPSGHMALAAAFAGVFLRLYRASILPFSLLLFLAAALLVVGDWHFVSDVTAGVFVGVSAGLLAGELWLVHGRRGR